MRRRFLRAVEECYRGKQVRVFRLRTAPRPRPDAWRPGHFPREAKQAAGLLLLLDQSRLQRERRSYEGCEYDVPYFDLCGEKVWGATAMVLAELATLLAARSDA